MSSALRLATRGSPLARWQAALVASLLSANGDGRAVETVIVETRGDRQMDLAIRDFAGQGLFIAEVEQAVLDGRADVAVHSAKDLPSGAPPEGLLLACVPVRADPRDALCGATLAGLAHGAPVGSGSVRRRAQLAAARPDLTFRELRGNIGTRLDAIPEGGAVVVAMAALERLGLAHRASEVLSTTVMLPQVGQGAIALRCREQDIVTTSWLARIDDEIAHRCVVAERSYLATIGGGCDAPVGAHAVAAVGGEEGFIELEGLLASEDGVLVIRRRAAGTDPVALGAVVAEAVVAAEGGTELVEAAQHP